MNCVLCGEYIDIDDIGNKKEFMSNEFGEDILYCLNCQENINLNEDWNNEN